MEKKAVLQTYVSRNKEWGNDASLFTPIAKDFFILTDVYAKKIRLYHAAPQQELQEITSKSLPGVPCRSWSCVNDGHYFQIEEADLYSKKLVEYAILACRV